ncbi:MAG: riboflavin synthase [Alphaproteobacteria bacterium]|nr:riboflavin synthase [Alphaproteobacteria bacterium]
MFTGLIQDIGRVRSIDKDGDWRIVIETNMDMSRHDIGASIACSGCCLTVVEKGADADGDWFAVDVSHESLGLTVIGSWEEGARVNLEPSLRLGDEMGGHIVSGHVDGLAELTEIKEDHDSWRLSIRVPHDLAGFIASKGSVALDGISLTVNEVEGDVFGVNIIPHTWEHTTLSNRRVGDNLNLEIDMLARYVARMLQQR